MKTVDLEQHRLEVHGFSYIYEFISINTVNVFSIPYDFHKNIYFSLAYFIVGIWYITQITYKVCVNQLLMVFVTLLFV